MAATSNGISTFNELTHTFHPYNQPINDSLVFYPYSLTKCLTKSEIEDYFCDAQISGEYLDNQLVMNKDITKIPTTEYEYTVQCLILNYTHFFISGGSYTITYNNGKTYTNTLSPSLTGSLGKKYIPFDEVANGTINNQILTSKYIGKTIYIPDNAFLTFSTKNVYASLAKSATGLNEVEASLTVQSSTGFNLMLAENLTPTGGTGTGSGSVVTYSCTFTLNLPSHGWYCLSPLNYRFNNTGSMSEIDWDFGDTLKNGEYLYYTGQTISAVIENIPENTALEWSWGDFSAPSIASQHYGTYKPSVATVSASYIDVSNIMGGRIYSIDVNSDIVNSPIKCKIVAV